MPCCRFLHEVLASEVDYDVVEEQSNSHINRCSHSSSKPNLSVIPPISERGVVLLLFSEQLVTFIRVFASSQYYGKTACSAANQYRRLCRLSFSNRHL